VGSGLARTFPRTANAVRTGRVMSRARSLELARRTAAGGNIARRAGRRVANFGRDMWSAGRHAVRRPGAFIVYSGMRTVASAGSIVAWSARGLWKVGKWTGIPMLMAFEDNITDALKRSQNREDALREVRDAGQALLREADGLSPEELAARIETVGDAFKNYRNRLMKPIHDEDLWFDSQLKELDAKVAAGEIPDNTIDARLDAMLEEYGRRRHNLMVELYDRHREEEHDMLHPSVNRTISFQDEIDLLEAVKAKLRDPAARELVDARIIDLNALMAYEYDLFRSGDHDVLIAGISGPPRPVEDLGLPAGLEEGDLDSFTPGAMGALEDMYTIEEAR